ncbi:FGGY-family carbohydrate kinase [Taklimakanibacter deserti]|uniref:FGGY-family carbohydrate kinase n=1 Tax=Taklimakanibacter deserti TaxID=2267839 RepID=UPI000E655365
MAEELRGIAVVDVGATNSKIVLFDSAGKVLAERKTSSRHVAGPLYPHLDPKPLVAFCAKHLPDLDGIMPIDVVVPAAHGAAIACLDGEGKLALPVMDYMAEPPADIIESYRKTEPPFSEVFSPLLPMALTHGMQLFWQEEDFPEQFAKVRTILPWIQYVGHLLSGKPVIEIASMSCQSQLMDVRDNSFSSLARLRGWDKLFARWAKAWEVIGRLKPQFRKDGFRGRGKVLAGIHDSSGNYLRYLAGGRKHFTLLSTGTWIIGFDTDTGITELDPQRDTVTNTDIFGKPIACCRFMGGREYEVLSRGASAEAASFKALGSLVAQGTFALPSFTDSGGPMPGTGNKGHVKGPAPAGEEERSTLAALYCALMVDRSLAAVKSRGDIIVDGPFAKNPVFLSVLASLRQPQTVLASQLRDGTTAGAMALALMTESGEIPRLDLDLDEVAPLAPEAIVDYAVKWRQMTGETNGG